MFLAILLATIHLIRGQEPSGYDQIRSIELDSTATDFIIYFSKGYNERALELSRLYEDSYSLFEDSLQVRPNIRVAALDEADWKKITITNRLPYGMPWIDMYSMPFVAFLPALPEKSFFALHVDKSEVPAKIIEELDSVGLSYQFMATRLVDVIGIHEIGHGFIRELNMVPNQKWLNELLAGYFMTIYAKYRRPELLTMGRCYNRVTQLTKPPAATPKYTTLEDFEKLYFGVGPENYGWYQERFHQRIDEMVDVYGFSFITKIKEQGLHKETDINTLLLRLEKIAPGFLQWSRNIENYVIGEDRE
jgi:hypothetical protein